MASKAPVMASKPVANTIASSWCSPCVVRRPVGVISVIGFAFTSTRSTLARLKVS